MNEDGSLTGNNSSYTYDFFGTDFNILDGSNNSYNLTQYRVQEYNLAGQLVSDRNVNTGSAVISDDLVLSNNAVLNVHGSQRPRYYNRAAPSLFVFTNIRSHLNVNYCGRIRLISDLNGRIEIGSNSPLQTANLTVNNGS